MSIRGLNSAMVDVSEEVVRAVMIHGDFASAHEGYAVIKEELEELWTEIKKKKEARDPERLREEALQLSAMALKFVLSLEHGSI